MPQKLIESGTTRKCGLVGQGLMTHTFNLDLEAGGYTLNLDHTPSVESVSLWDLRSFSQASLIVTVS